MSDVAAHVTFDDFICPHGLQGRKAREIVLESGQVLALTTAPAMHIRDVPPAAHAKIIRGLGDRTVLEICIPRGSR